METCNLDIYQSDEVIVSVSSFCRRIWILNITEVHKWTATLLLGVTQWYITTTIAFLDVELSIYLQETPRRFRSIFVQNVCSGFGGFALFEKNTV